MPRKRKGEAAQNGGAASPDPETPKAPLSLHEQRKAGLIKRDRRKRFNS
ncbi:hypothetical protein [Kribbella speibonae]|nr:hypothetical protein [Kribbella speibonae]